jgi:ectoine hydroxylase-related dioxygenase (phytanoyl-CoA dioxygenase family)
MPGKLQSVPPSTDLEEILGILDRDGCVVVNDLAPTKLVDTFWSEIGPYLEKTPKGSGEFVGFETRRTSSLIAKSKACGELATMPLILSVCDKILGSRCAHYQLATTQAVQIGPSETVQPFHRDDNIYPFAHPCSENVVTAIWAMTDFRMENGATRMVLGSHKWGDERQPKEGEWVPAEMSRGSAIIYYGSLYHSGGANRTSKPRTGVILGYSLGWLRQEENQYLAVPPTIAKTLPERLQRLIGYTLHEPFLGWFEMQDPHILLEGDLSYTAAAKDLTPPGQANVVLPQHVQRT